LRSSASDVVRSVLPTGNDTGSQQRELHPARGAQMIGPQRKSLLARGLQRRALGLWLSLVLALTCRGPDAAAQQSEAPQQAPSGIYARGDAAVTGFSGATSPIQIAPGTDPAEQTFIDTDGPSMRIIDLSRMTGRPDAQLVGAPKPLTVKAAQIGQV